MFCLPLLLPFSLSLAKLSLASAHSLPLSLSLLTMQPEESDKERIRSKVYRIVCIRQGWKTTCASAKNVHTYWCYLRGGKSTPHEHNFRAEEEAGVPTAPCHKIQGVCNYLVHGIRAHKKDPPCTNLSPRLRARETFLTPMRRFSRPSH